MSYAIIRIQKFHNQAVKGIEIHDTRTKNVSHTNPDIDRSRSGENYALAMSWSHFFGQVEAVFKLGFVPAQPKALAGWL